jgi:DNA-binding LacI/PurR family transcriptional regulator
LGYRPNYTARSLRSQRSRTIGYTWSPTPHGLTNPILDQFLQSMFHTAEQVGYYLLCFPYHEDNERQLAVYAELIDTGRGGRFICHPLNTKIPASAFYLIETSICRIWTLG